LARALLFYQRRQEAAVSDRLIQLIHRVVLYLFLSIVALVFVTRPGSSTETVGFVGMVLGAYVAVGFGIFAVMWQAFWKMRRT
jgi:hypothetical protein